ncbi:hypothetical protein HDU79_007509 [Rhizoclosmatium sp. JEL0117]|nr:hypothetical protein HDU79_007509 [Rhizoclosmatium sp. JEL0117]
MSPIPDFNVTVPNHLQAREPGTNPTYTRYYSMDINGYDVNCVKNHQNEATCASACYWSFGHLRFYTFNGNTGDCCCKKPTLVGDPIVLFTYHSDEMRGYDFPGRFDFPGSVIPVRDANECKSYLEYYPVTVYDGGLKLCARKVFDYVPGRPDVISGYITDD